MVITLFRRGVREELSGCSFLLAYIMFYLPYNTYNDITSRDFRYDALLTELCGQSIEIRRLKDEAASFNERESGIAKGKLRKILASIMQLRSVNAV